MGLLSGLLGVVSNVVASLASVITGLGGALF